MTKEILNGEIEPEYDLSKLRLRKIGFGSKNHKMILDHYRNNNKNMFISYDKKAVGFF